LSPLTLSDRGWTTAHHLQDFETTMAGLDSGLRVETIAVFPLKTCLPTERVDDVQERMEQEGIDHYPVCEGGHVVGVLDRDTQSTEALAGDAMHLLSEDMLVAASDPISVLLPLLRAQPYRLVVLEGRIRGIVTRSDLIKLPVSLHAFAQVTHLEILMARLIEFHLCEPEQWMAHLSPGRRDKVLERTREHAASRLDPDPLEFTMFCDKRTILKEELGLDDEFDADMHEVENLRNTIAHAGDYGGSVAELQRFIDRLEKAKKWINDFSGRLADVRTNAMQQSDAHSDSQS